MKFDHEALTRLREERGWNRRELADAAGVDPSTVTRLEKGERTNPTATVVYLLAKALGANIPDLIHE